MEGSVRSGQVPLDCFGQQQIFIKIDSSLRPRNDEDPERASSFQRIASRNQQTSSVTPTPQGLRHCEACQQFLRNLTNIPAGRSKLKPTKATTMQKGGYVYIMYHVQCEQYHIVHRSYIYSWSQGHQA